MLRQFGRGVLDSLIVATLVALGASNAGFMPLEGTQTNAHALFGGCTLYNCPATCGETVPLLIDGNLIWVTDVCDVIGTQFVGVCSGLCGVCPLGLRCYGNFEDLGGPCYCSSGGC